MKINTRIGIKASGEYPNGRPDMARPRYPAACSVRMAKYGFFLSLTYGQLVLRAQYRNWEEVRMSVGHGEEVILSHQSKAGNPHCGRADTLEHAGDHHDPIYSRFHE